MKVLLGADLLIIANDSKHDFGTIGWLFQWLDQLKIQKCIDFPTFSVMTHFGGVNKELLHSCKVIKKVIRKSPVVQQLNIIGNEKRSSYNESELALNAIAAQLAFLECGEVDFLISDNEAIHRLAKILNIDDKVYKVAEFIDKCAIENRQFDQSKGLIVEELRMSDLKLDDDFFKTFKEDYEDYEGWFLRKSADFVFVSQRNGKIIALLKLKKETSPLEYADVMPSFPNKKALKISSLKIEPNRTKLAERFMRIIINYAVGEDVRFIYATFFDNYERKHRLKRFFEKWGFRKWGNKLNSEEIVLYRSFEKQVNYSDPALTFPFHGPRNGIYLVYLDTTYANALLGNDKVSRLHDVEPLKNAISKVLISYNVAEPVKTGSIILFLTDLDDSKTKRFIGAGIVDGVHLAFYNETNFLRVCRKRSIFSDSRLKQYWDKQTDEKRISTIEFLYVCSFPLHPFSNNNITTSAININDLKTQQLRPITESQFRRLVNNSAYEKDYIVY